MSKCPADATTGEHFESWRRYECCGGPHDGLVVNLWRRARNVILIGPDGKAHEYLDMSVTKLSPILAATHIIGQETGVCHAKIEYSGWLTDSELKYAKELVDCS